MMVPQVIDAKGDIRDCQREHLSRKLTSTLITIGISSQPTIGLNNGAIG
jgi:hypothetical protein